MHNYILRSGTLVGVWVGGVLHKGVVSFVSGKSVWVISSSRRRGGAYEELLTDFLDGGELVVLPPLSALHPGQVAANARRALGRPWNLFYANCEHFVYESFGLPPQSPQLQFWLTSVTLGTVGAFMLSSRA